MCCSSGSDCFLAVIAFLFPPIAVWVKRGLCSADSLINIALCVLGYIPGLIHAWYIIASYPGPAHHGYEDFDVENGRVYYYTAVYPANRQRQQGPRTAAPKPQQAPSMPQHASPQQYGSIPSNAQVPQQSPPAVCPHQHQLVADSGESSSSQEPQQAPPSYSDVVKGDFKVQSRD